MTTLSLDLFHEEPTEEILKADPETPVTTLWGFQNFPCSQIHRSETGQRLSPMHEVLKAPCGIPPAPDAPFAPVDEDAARLCPVCFPAQP